MAETSRPADPPGIGPPPHVSALFGAALGSFLGGSLWLVVLVLMRAFPGGWPARLRWPDLAWVSLIPAGAAAGAIAQVLADAAERRRAEGLIALGAELGLEYAAEARRESLPSADLPALADWYRGRNHQHGRIGGVPVDVVDATLVVGSVGGPSTTRLTVVLLPALGEPDFDLRPRGSYGGVLEPLGASPVAFHARAAATPEDAEAVARFHRRWAVAPPLRLPPGGVAEAALRRSFSPRRMAALGSLGPCSAQCWGGRLAVWRGRGFLAAPARRALIDDALALRRALVEAPAGLELGRP